MGKDSSAFVCGHLGEELSVLIWATSLEKDANFPNLLLGRGAVRVGAKQHVLSSGNKVCGSFLGP